MLLAGALLWGGLGAAFSTGCVTIYQPQRAIHRPVVIQAAPTNFSGLRILVRCNSHKDFLPPGDASKLCGKLAEDLERQGAETEWVVPVGATWVQPEVFDGERPDLTVEIQSKIDHEYNYPVTIAVAVMTCSLIPAVSEQTYSQRVVVLGRDGSVLTEELFRERFVQYTGLGVWSANWVLDFLFRAKEDRLMNDAGAKEFSADFFGQIRQLTFNARIRSEILGLTRAPGRPALEPPPEKAAAAGGAATEEGAAPAAGPAPSSPGSTGPAGAGPAEPPKPPVRDPAAGGDPAEE